MKNNSLKYRNLIQRMDYQPQRNLGFIPAIISAASQIGSAEINKGSAANTAKAAEKVAEINAGAGGGGGGSAATGVAPSTANPASQTAFYNQLLSGIGSGPLGSPGTESIVQNIDRQASLPGVGQ